MRHCRQPSRAPDETGRIAEQHDRPLRARDHKRPCLGQAYPIWLPVEQPVTDTALKLVEPLRGGRLRQIHRQRGRADAAGSRDRGEQFEMAEIQVVRLHRATSIAYAYALDANRCGGAAGSGSSAG